MDIKIINPISVKKYDKHSISDEYGMYFNN